MKEPKKERRGGARWGHTPRKSNTGVQGVSEVRRPGRAPQLSASYRDASGQLRTKSFAFTEENRHVVLGQAAAFRAQHHVPAKAPE